MTATCPGHFAGARILLVSLSLAFAGLFAASPRLLGQQQQAAFDQGVDAFNKGNYDVAIGDFTQVIQLNPKSEDAYNNRGAAYQTKGDDDKAIADFNQAVQLNPQDPRAYCNRGVAYTDKGNYDFAIGDFTQALQIDPKNENAYNSRGLAYDRKGDYATAIADFNQAIRLNPKDANPYNNRGVSYRANGDYARALADYNQAIQLNPKYATAYRNLALLLATCPQAGFRDGKKAVAAATKACELSNWKFPYAVDTLAAADAEAGDFADAVKWETQFSATPNLSASEAEAAQNCLELYQTHKPYHLAR